jgi:hypothetical protein
MAFMLCGMAGRIQSVVEPVLVRGRGDSPGQHDPGEDAPATHWFSQQAGQHEGDHHFPARLSEPQTELWPAMAARGAVLKLATADDLSQIKAILSRAGASGETMLKNPNAKPENLPGFFLLDDHGVFWCKPIDHETLEVHTTFDPDHRGQYARDLARAGQRMVFTELDIQRVVTKCKLHHQYVVAFAKWMGFKQIGIVDDTIVLECTLDSYVMLDNDLYDFAIDAGFPLPDICPQEQANFAGFFVMCYRNGLLMKGLQTYNRMALLLDWEPLLLTSSNPILLTIGDRQFSPSSLTEA